MRENDVEVHRGSANVFADLGISGADDMLLKSSIVIELRHLIESRKLTQTAAAERIGIGQADLSKLLAGGLRGFSVERLMRMLTAFDQEVQIISRPRAADGKGGIVFKAVSA